MCFTRETPICHENRRDVLYIVDDINFLGGAHIATARLLERLVALGFSIDILTDKEPNDEALSRFKGLSIAIDHNKVVGWRRILRGVLARLGFHIFPRLIIDGSGKLYKLMSSYRCVCVMCEMSRYSWLVSQLPKSVRKVQLMHIDYVYWSTKTPGGRLFSKFDKLYYPKMDVLSVVGAANAEKLKNRRLDLGRKISSFHNVVPEVCRVVCEKAQGKGVLDLVTIGRMDDEQKDIIRSLRIARGLSEKGFRFIWKFIGNGNAYDRAREYIVKHSLEDKIKIEKWADNVVERLAEADLMVLLSHYEGLPNIVYESLLAGTPVFATDVGALRDQVQDGFNGWLVKDDDEFIERRLSAVLRDVDGIQIAKKNLQFYEYDNDKVVDEHLQILGLMRNS